ncbi:MAG: cobaltochelatase subunit CobT, partial [Rhodobacteraceae bacterium]|nr:cobaltochelatase subunit CobT [Paracoccaceae bacterium]
MTKPNDNPADPFKKALTEATKAMANEPELNVAYSVDPPGMSADTMRLPQVTRRMTKQEVLAARGTADALALKLRFHNEATHKRYCPTGESAVALYESLETARCEAAGARAMPGTRGNINALLETEAQKLGYDQAESLKDVPMPAALGYYLRHLATGQDLPPAVTNAMDQWRTVIEERSGDTFAGIDEILTDQVEFSKFARQLISDLGYGDELGDDPDEADQDQEDEAEEDPEDNEDQDSGDEQEQSDESEPSPDDQQPSAEQQAQMSAEELESLEDTEEMEAPDGMPPLDPPPPAHSDADPDYKVYTTDFDEEVLAEDLAEPAELERLRAYLDQQLEPLKG